MNDFRFANTEYLLLLLALPVVQLIISRFHANARERLLRFMAEPNLQALLKEKGSGGGSRKRILFGLGLALLILALARPQANPVTEEIEGASLDIYVLLDVSRSMDAEDVPPSRLAKAKRSIGSLTQLLAGDRVGVIAFAGTAVMVSPLTADYEVIKSFLQNVDSSLIPNQGTDLTNALAMAAEAMKRGAERTGSTGPRSNVFIVMSDGEDHTNEDWSVVDGIQKDGGTIFTIAFGTAAGATIPVRNDRGELSGRRRDRQGQEIRTVVQTKALEEIARRGGGQFYFSTGDEGEIKDILNRMQNLDRSGAALMRARVYQEYFWIPLILGIAFLLFSFFSARALWEKFRLKGAFVLLLFPLAAQADPRAALWDHQRRAYADSEALARAGKPEEAAGRLEGLLAEDPESPELNYDLGTYLIEAKKFDEGRAQLQRLVDRPNPLREKALFNVAGAFALENKKDEARAAYAETIRSLQTKNRNTDDNELLEMAKKNLARLATNPPPQQNQGQGGGESQDQDKKQDQKQDQQKSGDQKDKKDSEQDPQKEPEDKNKDKDKGKDKGEGKDKNKDEGDPEKDKNQQNKGESQSESESNPAEKPVDPKGMRPGKKPFKEKGEMAEDEAKRILEALKQRETGIQKKFMRQKSKGETSNNGGDKDW